MTAYDTVTEAISDLRKRGFTLDFNLAFDKLICEANGACLLPYDFEITEMYRFEGDSNPSDEDVVYAIESKTGEKKGIYSGAFGTYADEVSSEMIQKLTFHL